MSVKELNNTDEQTLLQIHCARATKSFIEQY